MLPGLTAPKAVNSAFPDVKYETWPACERLLPHARVSAELIERWKIKFLEAARLLNLTGDYLQERARYVEAEHLLLRALTIYEQRLEAEPLFKQALALREQVLEPQHPDVAESLNNLALLYRKQGKYALAEPLYQHAILIFEKAFGANHLNVATVLGNYADLLRATNREDEAIRLEQRAQAIRVKHAQENLTDHD